MSPPSDHEQAFVVSLTQLLAREDRAALAALRRGLGKAPGDAPELYPYVVPFLGSATTPWQEERYYLVAALFAWHQGDWPAAVGDTNHPAQTNFGASFARLRAATSSESIEKRFVALLNSQRDDLPSHLRHAVGLLKAHDIPVNWTQLLHDLTGWDWEQRPIQRAWANAFWSRAPSASSETIPPVSLT